MPFLSPSDFSGAVKPASHISAKTGTGGGYIPPAPPVVAWAPSESAGKTGQAEEKEKTLAGKEDDDDDDVGGGGGGGEEDTFLMQLRAASRQLSAVTEAEASGDEEGESGSTGYGPLTDITGSFLHNTSAVPKVRKDIFFYLFIIYFIFYHYWRERSCC